MYVHVYMYMYLYILAVLRFNSFPGDLYMCMCICKCIYIYWLCCGLIGFRGTCVCVYIVISHQTQIMHALSSSVSSDINIYLPC